MIPASTSHSANLATTYELNSFSQNRKIDRKLKLSKTLRNWCQNARLVTLSNVSMYHLSIWAGWEGVMTRQSQRRLEDARRRPKSNLSKYIQKLYQNVRLGTLSNVCVYRLSIWASIGVVLCLATRRDKLPTLARLHYGESGPGYAGLANFVFLEYRFRRRRV